MPMPMRRAYPTLNERVAYLEGRFGVPLGADPPEDQECAATIEERVAYLEGVLDGRDCATSAQRTQPP